MTYVSGDQRTNQRIKVYSLTTILLDGVFELPRWWSIDEWSRESVKVALNRCQHALDAVEDSVHDLGIVDDLDECSQAAILFAEAACLDCRGDIELVESELLRYAH